MLDFTPTPCATMRTVKRVPCGRCLQIVRCARIPLPADSRAARTPPLARTARSAAVEQVLIDCSHHQPIEEGWLLTCTLCFLQLLRIEEGGAFAGLVGGSPSVAGAHSRHDRKPLVRELDSRDARFVTELVAGECNPPEACMHHACYMPALEMLNAVTSCRGHPVAQAPRLAHTPVGAQRAH